MEKLETLINYLHNEVSAAERQEIEKELQVNESMQRDLQVLRDLDQTLHDDALISFVAKLQDTEKLYTAVYADEGEDAEMKASPRRRIFTWKYAVAASILILMVGSLVFFLSKPNSDELYASYYEKYESSVGTRSDGPANADELVQAILEYDKGNYEVALNQFNEILKNDATNTTARFFAGVSYIELQKFDKAIDNLWKVVNKNDAVFIEQAEWYISLCFIKTNQQEQASVFLTRICKRNGYYKVKAQDLLNKLK